MLYLVRSWVMTIVCHPLAGRCRVGSVSDGMPEFIFLDRDIGSVTFIKLMSVRAGISSPVEFFYTLYLNYLHLLGKKHS
jgi:hypothetical protein